MRVRVCAGVCACVPMRVYVCRCVWMCADACIYVPMRVRVCAHYLCAGVCGTTGRIGDDNEGSGLYVSGRDENDRGGGDDDDDNGGDDDEDNGGDENDEDGGDENDEHGGDENDEPGGDEDDSVSRRTRKGIPNKTWPPPIAVFSKLTFTENVKAAKVYIKYMQEGRFRQVYSMKGKGRHRGYVYRCNLHVTDANERCPAMAMWRGDGTDKVTVHTSGAHAPVRVEHLFGVPQEHMRTVLERARPSRGSTSVVTRTIQFDVQTGVCPDNAPPAPSAAAVGNMLRRARPQVMAALQEEISYNTLSLWLDTQRSPPDAEAYRETRRNQVMVLANEILRGLGFVFSSVAVSNSERM
eukprot:GHVU01227547.1.p1 GENE.GHVU01227547.1~~GHVU01227547.1.p1  ORF type:complete len:353 (-),score=37.27 GHVU01227547.1:210-1268(-)